jgi:SHS2 domain-containing protein
VSWETFEHEADVGLVIRGHDGPELFAQAGLALFDLVCDLEQVEARDRYPLAGEADAVEPLLVDWLNDLVYLFQARGVVCRSFAFPVWSEKAYAAEAFGEPVDPQRHAPRDLVKAATYHGLSVAEVQDGLEARVILDV